MVQEFVGAAYLFIALSVYSSGGMNVKSLVIVESPAKAKPIETYLGRKYTVKASVGHVADLPKSQFGVDVQNGFKPTDVYIAMNATAIILRKKFERRW